VVAELVLVSGPPGAGKSTLARRLAGDLRMALVAKDTIKEALGDTLAAESVERSQELGRASVGVLYAIVREQLELGVPVVVDHAFHQDLAGEAVPLVERAVTVLVHCRAPVAVLSQRVAEREQRGHRHAVHTDGERRIVWERYAVMELDVPVLFVDTTDGYRPDYPTIVNFVETAG
jgi:predicted kinase